MNIGVLKIGARISCNGVDKTSGVTEIFFILNLLAKKHNINIYTKILDKDVNDTRFNFNNILDIENITDDILLVFNGNLNFFGGVEDPAQIKNYILTNRFKGPIYHILNDCNLCFKQEWNNISRKPWGSKYKEEDILVTNPNIKTISHFYNKDFCNELINDNKNHVKIKKENMFYFPIHVHPFFTLEHKQFKEDYKYELLYWGSFRSGRRRKKMLEYYFDNGFKTSMIGSINIKDFKSKNEIVNPPEFLSSIDIRLLQNEINNSLATVCIGDKDYEGNAYTIRIAEAISNNIVCFIDLDMDPKKQLFKDDEVLYNFNYVSSKEELKQKLEKVKNDLNFRKDIIERQSKCFTLNEDDYSNMLNSIIEKEEIKSEINFNKVDSIYTVKDFYQTNILEKDWSTIEKTKKSYYILNNIQNKLPQLLRYPGFSFSSDKDALFYYENFYKHIETTFTPPRGNLSNSNKYIFIGIKPGNYNSELGKSESAWLFGPSSEMLNKLLLDLKIYPYFTNVYKSCNDEENKDINLIMKELNIINKIAPNTVYVFMGNYDEYDLIIDKLKLKETQYIKIWHPSFLCRSYTEEKYKQWKEQILDKNIEISKTNIEIDNKIKKTKQLF